MNGKMCLVSGANRGLGLAIVSQALDRGWSTIALSHRDECPELHSLDREGRLQVLVGDTTDPATMDRVREALVSRNQGLDLLVNNAAILGDIERRLGDGLDHDDALRVYQVNVLGPLRLTETVLPWLLRGHGPTVAHISSEAGSIASCGRDGWYAYNMSKAALNMQGRIMHNHLRPLGGRVMMIHPGWVRTWIKGRFDHEATLDAHDAARGVWDQIDRYRNLEAIPEIPPFVDGTGRDWPW